jgi:hypothetical protein
VKVTPATVGDKSSAAINHTLGKFGLFIFDLRTFLAVPAAREKFKAGVVVFINTRAGSEMAARIATRAGELFG